MAYAINFMEQNYFVSHETVLGSEKPDTEEGKIEIFLYEPLANHHY